VKPPTEPGIYAETVPRNASLKSQNGVYILPDSDDEDYDTNRVIIRPRRESRGEENGVCCQILCLISEINLSCVFETKTVRNRMMENLRIRKKIGMLNVLVLEKGGGRERWKMERKQL
jgi:hypothetical protein